MINDIKSIAHAVSLAALSWLFSLLVYEAYTDPTWQYLASLAMVNFVFMVIFAFSKINDQKARWICTMLAIAILFTMLSSVIYYMYQHYIIGPDNWAVNLVLGYYGPLCFSLSLLIMIVSTFNDKVMDKIDGLFWPTFARNFRRSFDVWRVHCAKKGAF